MIATLTLTEEDVKQAVKEYAERQTGKLAGKISVNVGLEYRGYGPHEGKVALLKDVTIELIERKPQVRTTYPQDGVPYGS